jgi:hypothetical protein
VVALRTQIRDQIGAFILRLDTREGHAGLRNQLVRGGEITVQEGFAPAILLLGEGPQGRGIGKPL